MHDKRGIPGVGSAVIQPCNVMEQGWTYSVDNALHYFNVSRTQGLSSEAARAKLAKYGPNGMWWLMRVDINLHLSLIHI